ncbi:MAG: carboxypeptidase-like regulatory domain-containing protein, partial [Ferruginibacter sp.]
MKRIIFLSFALCFFHSSFSQKTGSITGFVVDKASQQPLEGTTIKLDGTEKATVADNSGKFRITNIPVNSYNLEVSKVGYKTFTLYNIVISSGNENSFTIEMEQQVTSLTAIEVKANKRTVRAATLETPLSVQRLTSEEIKSNPGGNFDISKVIQTLPGVGGGQQGGSFRNDIIIRGGAP